MLCLMCPSCTRLACKLCTTVPRLCTELRQAVHPQKGPVNPYLSLQYLAGVIQCSLLLIWCTVNIDAVLLGWCRPSMIWCRNFKLWGHCNYEPFFFFLSLYMAKLPGFIPPYQNSLCRSRESSSIYIHCFHLSKYLHFVAAVVGWPDYKVCRVQAGIELLTSVNAITWHWKKGLGVEDSLTFTYSRARAY